MSTIIFKELKKALTRNDIDFRVGSVITSGQKAFATILAYKDARVDMNILDDVCGTENWQVEYIRDSKGVLQCRIGIYNAELSQWVWKASNGIESNTEKQKGEYSDAFKRAGFMWGIGRELYNFPTIFIPLEPEEFKIEANKAKGTSKLRPNDWEWIIDDDYKKIIAKDKNGKVRYNHSEPNVPANKPAAQAPATAQQATAAPEKVNKDVLPEGLLGEIAQKMQHVHTREDLEVLWGTYKDYKGYTNVELLFKNKGEKLKKAAA